MLLVTSQKNLRVVLSFFYVISARQYQKNLKFVTPYMFSFKLDPSPEVHVWLKSEKLKK